jgi:hypothetical protein
MVIVRLISVFFIALALMILGADLMFWLETSSFEPHTLIGIWHLVSSPSANALQVWVNGLPDLANATMDSVLGAWAFVAVGIPGVVLAIIGSRR